MKGFCLEITGDYACFTRPEMKVERVSYDVITPSAARGIFEAIFWKPEIKWRILKIEVLNPVSWATIRRNEVGRTASTRSVELFIEEDRQQRAALILKDVKFRVHAEFDLMSANDGSCASSLSAKYASMFQRRAEKGQCFTQPYLGCREFACDFKYVEPNAKLANPIGESRDLGWMLYDLDFAQHDSPSPLFFRAIMNNGVVIVPHPDSEEVRR